MALALEKRPAVNLLELDRSGGGGFAVLRMVYEELTNTLVLFVTKGKDHWVESGRCDFERDFLGLWDYEANQSFPLSP